MTLQQFKTMQPSADGPPRLFAEMLGGATYTDSEGTTHVLRGVFNNTAADGTAAVRLIDGGQITLRVKSGQILPGFFLYIESGGTLDPDAGDVLGVL